MEAFITAGIIPNSLLGIITKQLETAKGGSEPDLSEVEEMFQDPSKFQDVLDLVDNVLLYCVVMPKVMPVSHRDEIMAREDATDEEKKIAVSMFLYPDMVDLEDKFFIFNYAVGGTRDLERFRTELAANVADVQPRKTVVKPTKRTGGAKKR
jgi:hypothetical protein